MTDYNPSQKTKPVLAVEHILEPLPQNDLNDLCDSTDAAIESGGGFGWVNLPARDILERYWQGVITAPTRWLFVARIDGVICGTAQLILPAHHDEMHKHLAQLTTNFVSPWARGHGLARLLIEEVEKKALEEGISVINLNVLEDMNAAIQLYESLGYIQCGTHPYYGHSDNRVLVGRYYYKIIDEKAVNQQR